MPISEEQRSTVRRFMELFKSYEKAHGRYKTQTTDEDGKVTGRAQTVIGAATEETFIEHLMGGENAILGLIPIRDDNTCYFGAIDVDIKPAGPGQVKLTETLPALEKRIADLQLPLVLCRSKSGGAHLYLFLSEPASATLVMSKLNEFAAVLGYGGAEVFPKQTSRANEGDRGNWINICYFGGLSPEGAKDRYALLDGQPLPLEKFVALGEATQISASALRQLEMKLGDVFNDGPPCLQHLASLGFNKGGRNISLTNVAIYFKKKNPDDWQRDTEEFNFKHFQPPLTSSEVTQIIKNVTRKEYFYTCKQSPLVNHCDKKTCAKRDFGIGELIDSGEIFPLEGLVQYRSKDSVRWCAGYQGKRIELTTDELLSPEAMQKIFLEKFCIMVKPAKKQKWHEKINELLRTVEVLEDPEDASRQGQFEKLLDNFLTQSVPAKNKEELLKGNCWSDSGRVYFRSEDLFTYLTVRRFVVQPQDVWSWLDNLKAAHKQMRIKGKMLRVWSVPEPERYDGTDMEVKHLEEEL